MPVVKIGWSGGKDSTCAVMHHIKNGDKVKAVCYIPMFTQEIPLISKKHYSFILQTAEYFRSLGAEIHIVSGMTYYDYVTHVAQRGKNKGKIFGFPFFVRAICGFKRDSKQKALLACDVGFYDYESLGICADEKARHKQLNDKKRSILVERGITQNGTRKFCEEHNLLSPHYLNEWQKRDGCSLCPHASEKERKVWFSDYPEAVPIVIELQELVKKERPEQTPLRGHRWFIEPEHYGGNYEKDS